MAFYDSKIFPFISYHTNPRLSTPYFEKEEIPVENALFALLAPAQDEEAACLAAVREAAARHGLSVTPEEALALANTHRQALHDAGRIEISGTVLPKLAASFAASPYAPSNGFALLLGELCGWFYHFKNTSLEPVGDDGLVAWMRYAFDHRCMGQPELLQREWERRLGRADDSYSALPGWFDD